MDLTGVTGVLGDRHTLTSFTTSQKGPSLCITNQQGTMLMKRCCFLLCLRCRIVFPWCRAVFTTSQKKTMLKWLDKLNGQEAAAADSGTAAKPWTLLDITQTTAEVMDEEGDTQQVDLGLCDTELVQQIRKLFEAEDEVCVELGVRHGKTAIVRLVRG